MANGLYETSRDGETSFFPASPSLSKAKEKKTETSEVFIVVLIIVDEPAIRKVISYAYLALNY